MGLGRDFSLFRFNVLREMTAKLSGSRGTPYDRYVAGLVQIHFEVSKMYVYDCNTSPEVVLWWKSYLHDVN